VALVGHLDVVPPTDDDRVAVRRDLDGVDVVVGRGTSDMHSGNAVALELLATHPGDAPVDVVLVLYAREEGPADDNELADVLAAVPWLAEVDLAVVLEPTDGEVQAGCLGGLHATVTFRGRQAHSARPWHGRNALTAAGPFLAALDALAPEPVDVDGIRFLDVWSATMAATSSARNVIPGEFTVNLNLRFAPSRDAAAAEAELRERVAGWTAGLEGASVEVTLVDVAPPAPPRLDAPLVQQLLAATGATVAGKQAWTDVARFAELDVPAVNYGPGLTPQAHQRGEHVPVAALLDVHDRLAAFLHG
jgi:succinyl-diaminopimelate desuccinylase